LAVDIPVVTHLPVQGPQHKAHANCDQRSDAVVLRCAPVGYRELPQASLHTATIRRHSTAQHSTAQHSTAQHSAAQHSTAQHSTAQRSTAQRSAAQRSAAQHSATGYSASQHSAAGQKGSRSERQQLMHSTMHEARPATNTPSGTLTCW